jgi:hypothetical protein
VIKLASVAVGAVKILVEVFALFRSVVGVNMRLDQELVVAMGKRAF